MILNLIHQQALATPVRTIRPKVELYNGSTLEATYTPQDDLISFDVERVGEGKFFGFGICQKVNVKLIDKERVKNITTSHSIKISFTVGDDTAYPFPQFFVTECRRNENTNALSITAYDILYFASGFKFNDLLLEVPYTVKDCATAIADLLLLDGISVTLTAAGFNTTYETGANFTGDETIRFTLDAIAEATQTIYFVGYDNKLRFRQIGITKSIVATIGKSLYFELDSGENRRLATITHVTELGDNVSVATSATGSTQYVRDNPFWVLREDIGTLLNNAITWVGGATNNQFYCKWRGNYLYEPVDCLKFTTKDDKEITAHIINDVISYDGSLLEVTEWEFDSNDMETDSNPASLGDALKQTYARVDKANREIELVAREVSGNAEAISALQLNTEGIVASVQKMEQATEDSLQSLNGDIATITSKVDAAITSEDVQLQIETELANGVDKVTTTTGFTFNEEGLTVSKSGSEMETTITEDGMTVYRNEEAVLIADHEGVKAEDLHATTYLIIGTNSRFEDYLDNRTGCFWIGGNS